MICSFVGTDMHNMRTRKPETESAVVWMEKHLEPDYVKKLFLKNPEKILRNEYLKYKCKYGEIFK